MGSLAGTAAVLAALGLVAAPPVVPDRPGPWRQLGATAVSSKKPIVSFRSVVGSPTAIAIVAHGPAGVRLHLQWSTYCEIFDDDTGEENRQGTAAGAGRVTVYPSVL